MHIPTRKLQATAIINNSYKYLMDLTTNGIVITDAIKFVQINKDKLSMSTKEDNNGSKKKPLVSTCNEIA
jgi:hypothetical protein